MPVKHPKTEEVIELILQGKEYKVIAFDLGIAYNTVRDICHKYTGISRYRKPRVDPDQLDMGL